MQTVFRGYHKCHASVIFTNDCYWLTTTKAFDLMTPLSVGCSTNLRTLLNVKVDIYINPYIFLIFTHIRSRLLCTFHRSLDFPSLLSVFAKESMEEWWKSGRIETKMKTKHKTATNASSWKNRRLFFYPLFLQDFSPRSDTKETAVLQKSGTLIILDFQDNSDCA